MYDFVDRPVASLNRGGRLLIWAMRHWVRAVQNARCPCSDVGPAFHKSDLMAGFPHFHVMMTMLNRHARETLRFGAVDCMRVSEHEAIIISMVRAMRDHPASQAERAAALIIGEDQVAHLLIPMSALARALEDADFFPAPPASHFDCTRFFDE